MVFITINAQFRYQFSFPSLERERKKNYLRASYFHTYSFLLLAPTWFCCHKNALSRSFGRRISHFSRERKKIVYTCMSCNHKNFIWFIFNRIYPNVKPPSPPCSTSSLHPHRPRPLFLTHLGADEILFIARSFECQLETGKCLGDSSRAARWFPLWDHHRRHESEFKTKTSRIAKWVHWDYAKWNRHCFHLWFMLYRHLLVNVANETGGCLNWHRIMSFNLCFGDFVWHKLCK